MSGNFEPMPASSLSRAVGGLAIRSRRVFWLDEDANNFSWNENEQNSECADAALSVFERSKLTIFLSGSNRSDMNFEENQSPLEIAM